MRILLPNNLLGDIEPGMWRKLHLILKLATSHSIQVIAGCCTLAHLRQTDSIHLHLRLVTL